MYINILVFVSFSIQSLFLVLKKDKQTHSSKKMANLFLFQKMRNVLFFFCRTKFSVEISGTSISPSIWYFFLYSFFSAIFLLISCNKDKNKNQKRHHFVTFYEFSFQSRLCTYSAASNYIYFARILLYSIESSCPKVRCSIERNGLHQISLHK